MNPLLMQIWIAAFSHHLEMNDTGEVSPKNLGKSAAKWAEQVTQGAQEAADEASTQGKVVRL